MTHTQRVKTLYGQSTSLESLTGVHLRREQLKLHQALLLMRNRRTLQVNRSKILKLKTETELHQQLLLRKPLVVILLRKQKLLIRVVQNITWKFLRPGKLKSLMEGLLMFRGRVLSRCLRGKPMMKLLSGLMTLRELGNIVSLVGMKPQAVELTNLN